MSGDTNASGAKTNRFSKLMESVRERPLDEPSEVEAPRPSESETVAETREMHPAGRSGKRSDPNFVQISAYIPKETHRAVKRALLDREDEKNLSELLSELLEGWINTKT
jgi:hypothetical protein